jgi:membrane protease YdiL (CAAX protease family)
MTSYTESGRRTSRLRQIMCFPLVRIILASLVLLIGVGGVQALVIQPLRVAPALSSLAALGWLALFLASSVLVAFGCYGAYVRYVERRRVDELSSTHAARELGVGGLIGGALFATTILLLWLLAYAQPAATPGAMVVIVALVVDIAGAVVEELLFRGILFRITEEAVGAWLALAVSVLVFSALHPDASIANMVAVGLAGGLLPSAAYARTRRLWLPIGIHIGWDLVQNSIFGVAIAGHQLPGVLHAPLDGPPLLTGGSMGPEGSLVALVIGLAVSTYLLARARRLRRLRNNSPGGRPAAQAACTAHTLRNRQENFTTDREFTPKSYHRGTIPGLVAHPGSGLRVVPTSI